MGSSASDAQSTGCAALLSGFGDDGAPTECAALLVAECSALLAVLLESGSHRRLADRHTPDPDVHVNDVGDAKHFESHAVEAFIDVLACYERNCPLHDHAT